MLDGRSLSHNHNISQYNINDYMQAAGISARKILKVLAMLSKKYKAVFPSHTYIAKQVGLRRETVGIIIRMLAKMPYFLRFKSYRKSKDRLYTSVYSVSAEVIAYFDNDNLKSAHLSGNKSLGEVVSNLRSWISAILPKERLYNNLWAQVCFYDPHLRKIIEDSPNCLTDEELVHLF